MYIPNHYSEDSVLKFESESITYKVNEAKGTVTAIAKFYDYKPYDCVNDYFQTVGVAKLKKGDKFDEATGKKIARAKAEKEAFIVFKNRMLNLRKIVSSITNTIDNTIDKMDRCIQHQKEYISKF